MPYKCIIQGSQLLNKVVLFLICSGQMSSRIRPVTLVSTVTLQRHSIFPRHEEKQDINNTHMRWFTRKQMKRRKCETVITCNYSMGEKAQNSCNVFTCKKQTKNSIERYQELKSMLAHTYWAHFSVSDRPWQLVWQAICPEKVAWLLFSHLGLESSLWVNYDAVPPWDP